MLRHAISTLVLGTGLGLGACGDSSDGYDSDSDRIDVSYSDSSQWFAAFVDEFCLQTDACCRAAGDPSDPNTCRRLLNRFAAGSVDEANYDAVIGRQCLAELTAQKGQCTGASPAICADLFTGTSPEGGECEVCESEGFCGGGGVCESEGPTTTLCLTDD